MASQLDFTYNLTGGAANTDPNLSLGGVVSTSVSPYTPGTPASFVNNLFDDVTGSEHAAGDIEYRAFAVTNNGTSGDTLTNLEVFIDTNTASPDTTIEIGIDTGGINAPGSETLADENTAPAGTTVVFTTPAAGTPILIGTLAPGDYQVIWIKRTVINTNPATSYAADKFKLNFPYSFV